MFYVGHGEAVLVRFPDDRAWIIEAGSGSDRSWADNNTLGAALAGYLEREGLTLDAIVISHAHLDHAGAVPLLLQTGGYDFSNPLPLYKCASTAWQDGRGWLDIFFDAIRDDGDMSLQTIRRGPRVVTLEDGVGADPGIFASMFADPGAGVYRSLFVKLQFHGAKILFTGDAKCPYEDRLRRAVGDDLFRSDVLKITHHGSSSGTHADVVAAVQHGIAIASTGDDRSHYLERDTLRRVTASMRQRSRVYETLVRGDVILRTDGIIYREQGHPDGILYEVTFNSPCEFAAALDLQTQTLTTVNGNRGESPHRNCLTRR